MSKKEEKKVINIVLIAVMVISIIVIAFSFIQPEKAVSIWEGIKGELASLRPGIAVSKGLVAYYKFDGNANDAVGRHDGRVHGASLTDGISGKAYEFESICVGSSDYIIGSGDYGGSGDYIKNKSCIEGSDDYINIPFRKGDELDFSNKKEITTSFWLNLKEIPADNDGGSRPLYWEDRHTNYGNERIEWFATDAGRGAYKLSWRIMNQSGSISKSNCFETILYNKWHMFTGIYEGYFAKMYIDGEVCGADFTPGVIHPTTSGNDWIVGDATPDKKLGIVGEVDELRIYNRALSEQEIALLFLGRVDVDVIRDITNPNYNTYSVTLGIVASPLMNNEIMMVAERIPDGVSIVKGSWNIEPANYSDNILIWMFANNPPMYFGSINASQEIPPFISYEVSGGSGGEFRGKWGLVVTDIDGVIRGDSKI